MDEQLDYEQAVPFKTVRGIPVYFQIKGGRCAMDFRFVELKESSTRLTDELDNYVGTSKDFVVIARIGPHHVLGSYRVRYTRYTSEQPRWFASWRLNRAINKAVRLLK